VTNLVGAIHKVSGLAKEGMDTSGDNNCLNLSLFAGGTGEDLIARVLGDWQGFTGESRLVDFQWITLQEAGISRDDISQLDADQISWYQHCCILLTPLSIPQHLQIVKILIKRLRLLFSIGLSF
jgi:hypothetical protein